MDDLDFGEDIELTEAADDVDTDDSLPEIDGDEIENIDWDVSDEVTDESSDESGDIDPEEAVLPSDLGEITTDTETSRLTDEPIEVDMPFDAEKYDSEAFIEQTQMQEEGLNDLTVAEFLENSENRAELGRSPEGTDIQQQYRLGLKESIAFDRMEENPDLSSEDALALAESETADMAALHNPDQTAGGDPTDIHAMGSSKVNSALGSLWGHGRADDLRAKVQELSEDMTEEEKENTKLNVRLNPHEKQ